MSWIEQTIAEFGRGLGIDDLRLNERRHVQLALGSGGLLGIEVVEDTVLVFLSREVSPHDPELRMRALRLCHFKRQWPFPVQAGLRGNDRLILLARIPERQFSLSTLEQAMDLLVRLHGMVRG